jgi:hypothetical protein
MATESKPIKQYVGKAIRLGTALKLLGISPKPPLNDGDAGDVFAPGAHRPRRGVGRRHIP